jgi:hypothetical protein
MPEIDLSMLKNHLISPAGLPGWNWNKEIEPKLRATAVRQTLVSTQLLGLRDPGLNPVVLPLADGYAVFHGSDAMGSFAREVATTRPISANELSMLEQFYSDYGCRIRLWVSGRTHPSLLEMLRDRGYGSGSHSLIWFRSLDSDPISAEYPDIQVQPVAANLYNHWIQTVAAGFFEGHESVGLAAIPTSFIDMFFALGSAPDDQAFVAGKHGEFVGGAVLNVADGIAMLRTASTRFTERNTGVHQALLAARLECARAQGARIAVSQTAASGPSAHNLRKLGFQPFRVGCMMEKSMVP